MAEPRPESPESPESPQRAERAPGRVFVNDMESYASRHIAAALCEPAAGRGEAVRRRSGARAFHVVGTVSAKCHVDTSFALEEYLVSERERVCVCVRERESERVSE
ncbi:hypothetical protein EYF80_067988 [Liparis tanakae]|uniref:Uncharacterized protein n=1 Tax=Liparis tanakae TaxID=230148 RepID=A0A4Z2E072_9TELE|nr:hypothetical protein EYF80_067988 [Liparis tanakae]